MTVSSIKSRIGVTTIIILTVIPIIPWVMMRPLDLRFFDTFSTLTSIGQVTGLIGTMLYALSFVLSARFKFIEKYFGGLDRVYHWHHVIGALSFTFLVIHPLVLAARLISVSAMDAAKFLIPSAGNLAINLGIISLVITMALLVETFYSKKLPYRIKRFTKKFFGFAFFLGALHAFVIPSDISNSLFLKVYFFIICGVALWCFVYRSFLENILVKKYLYTVEAVNVLGQGITEIIMRPQLQRMEYEPGQFVFLSIIGEGVDDEVHPFTVSSSPAEEHLGITIKALGDWSTDIQHLKVGAIAKVEGPFGHFSYINSHNSKQIWVGGGVGVTPFLSFLRTLRVNNRPDLWVDFYYATKSADQMIFRPEIEQIVQQCPNVRLIPHASDDSGFLSADIIEAQSKNIQNADIFVCGPPPMMKSLAAQFSKANVPKHAVHMEAFKLL